MLLLSEQTKHIMMFAINFHVCKRKQFSFLGEKTCHDLVDRKNIFLLDEKNLLEGGKTH